MLLRPGPTNRHEQLDLDNADWRAVSCGLVATELYRRTEVRSYLEVLGKVYEKEVTYFSVIWWLCYYPSERLVRILPRTNIGGGRYRIDRDAQRRIMDYITKEVYPDFPVVNGNIIGAKQKALEYLVRTYEYDKVRKTPYGLKRRDDDGLFDQRTEEIWGITRNILAGSFLRCKLYPALHYKSRLFPTCIFDNRIIKPFYELYEMWHPLFRQDGLDLLTPLQLEAREHAGVRPLDYFAASFITGGTVSGVTRVFKLFDRGIQRSSPHVGDLVAVMIDIMRTCEMMGNEPVKLEVPPPHFDLFERSGGINMFATGKVNVGPNLQIDYVRQATKRGACPTGTSEVYRAMHRIKDALVKNPDLHSGAADEHSMHNGPNAEIMPTIVSSTFVKAEMRGLGDDPDKARLIFVVGFIKYAVDCMLFEKPIKEFYDHPPIAIGWSKSKHGMAYLLAHMTQYDQLEHGIPIKVEWFSFDGDFSKLDFTMTAALLTIIGFAMLWFYDDASKDYGVFRFLAEWTTDELVTKILHLFPDVVRMVVGMMFSGNFLTSWGDSVYCWIIFELWYRHVYRSLVALGKVNEAAHWKLVWPMPVWVYGDDHLGRLPDYVYPFWVGKDFADRCDDDKPVAFAEFVKKVGNLVVKFEESGVFFDYDGHPSYETIVDTCGIVRKRGPKFLQRYFVRVGVPTSVWAYDENTVDVAWMPYRETSAYYTRASNTVNGGTPAHYLLKLRGLAVDTAGCNSHAYLFLRFIHDGLIRRDPQLLYDVMAINVNSDVAAADYKRRCIAAGLPLTYGHASFPDYGDLQDKFWPRKLDVEVTVKRAMRHGQYPHMLKALRALF